MDDNFFTQFQEIIQNGEIQSKRKKNTTKTQIVRGDTYVRNHKKKRARKVRR